MSALPFDLRSIDRQTLSFYKYNMSGGVRNPGESTPVKAQHLAVLVHGLWGNASHLSYIAQSLHERYSDEELVVLACRRTAGSLTYDGIEVGAERVAKEIEDMLESLSRDGYEITRFSVIGYSLGGLVARYAIGLLYHKGYFEKMKPVNFTTFVTPHLGVRTPLTGWPNHLWNVLGARTLSMSGRQLFMIDNFRDLGRPLLSVLADPDSIFIHALAQFENRSLFTNIINDKSAVYYTTGISKKDPFANLDRIKINYVKGYEPVILDPDHPCDLITEQELPTFYQRVRDGSHKFVRRIPIFVALAIIVPIATVAFLINSCIQTLRSHRRIYLHENSPEGLGFGVYRIPYMVREMRVGLEDAFENVNSAQQQEYLPEGSEEMADVVSSSAPASPPNASKTSLPSEKSDADSLHKGSVTSERLPDFPTLALTTTQFAMVKALDDVGFRKYPVYIHKSSHSHAAIIRRTDKAAFDEGKTVIKHWLDNEFKI